MSFVLPENSILIAVLTLHHISIPHDLQAASMRG
jgi:hypothetical protein